MVNIYADVVIHFCKCKCECKAVVTTQSCDLPVAIWMLPREEHYGMWPASGEIDIVESRGNLNYMDEKGQPFGKEWIASTLHWGPYFAQNQFKRTQGVK